MDFKYTIVTFNLKESERLLKDLDTYYTKNQNVEIIDAKDSDEIKKILKEKPQAALLAYIESREHIISLINILSINNKKNKDLYSIVFTSSKNKKLENVLIKSGCNEILKPDINYRTVSFKIDNHIKKITTAQKTNLSDRYETKNSERQLKQNKFTKNEVKMIESLELGDDVWTMRSKTDHKKFLRRWLIRLVGPSLQLGRWIEVENKNKNSKFQYWQFSYEDDVKEQFSSENGNWIFQGSKPEFDWKHSWWSFTSEKPALFFLHTEGEKSYRFFSDKDNLFLRENSQISPENRALIDDSCQIKHKIESEKKAKDDEEKRINANTHLDKYMRGKDSEADEFSSHESSESNYNEKSIEKNYKGDLEKKSVDKKEAGNKSDFNEDQIEKHYKGNINAIPGKEDKETPMSVDEKRSTSKDKEQELKKNVSETSDLAGSLDSASAGEKKANTSKSNYEEEQIEKHYKGKTALQVKNQDEKKKAETSTQEESLKREENSEVELRKMGSTTSKALKEKEKTLKEQELKTRKTEKKRAEEKQKQAKEAALKLEKQEKEHLEEDYKEQEKKKQREGQKNKSTHESEKIDRTFKERSSETTQKAPIKERPESEKQNKKESGNIHSLDVAKKQKNEKIKDEKEKLSKKENHREQETASSQQKKSSFNEVKEKSEYGEDYYRIGTDSKNEISTESGKITIKVSSQNGLVASATLSDFYEDELSVFLEKPEFSNGDDLLVKLILVYNKKEIILNFNTTVENYEAIDDRVLYILNVKDLSEKDYNDFLNLYNDRQENIHSFMLQAKGA